jgi:hypothetical protein
MSAGVAIAEKPALLGFDLSDSLAMYFMRECNERLFVHPANNSHERQHLCGANSGTPRVDSEGINMDAAPPPTAQPYRPADALAPVQTRQIWDPRQGRRHGMNASPQTEVRCAPSPPRQSNLVRLDVSRQNKRGGAVEPRDRHRTSRETVRRWPPVS